MYLYFDARSQSTHNIPIVPIDLEINIARSRVISSTHIYRVASGPISVLFFVIMNLPAFMSVARSPGAVDFISVPVMHFAGSTAEMKLYAYRGVYIDIYIALWGLKGIPIDLFVLGRARNDSGHKFTRNYCALCAANFPCRTTRSCASLSLAFAPVLRFMFISGGKCKYTDSLPANAKGRDSCINSLADATHTHTHTSVFDDTITTCGLYVSISISIPRSNACIYSRYIPG